MSTRERSPRSNPITFLSVVLAMTCVVLVWFGWTLWDRFDEHREVKERTLRIEALRGTILHLDEVLTMSARMAAATGDPQWEARYNRHEPELDGAIKEAMSLAPEVYGGDAASVTDAANLNLVEMERQAFEAVRRGRADEAGAILNSDRYRSEKRIYAEGMSTLAMGLSEYISAGLQGEYHQALLHISAVMLLIPFLFISLFLVYRAVRKWHLDITESNLRLQRMNDELNRKNAELDEFTYVASHDLQEPLRKLISFSALLKKDVGDDLSARAEQDLQYITDASVRMKQLIQDLLTLSRTGRIGVTQELLSLETCVDEALDALSVILEETRAEISRDALPDVWGDKRLLTQVYQNLIGNAIKFTEHEAPQIHLTVENVGEEKVFGVRDNGIGINPEYASHIFVPFKRLNRLAEYMGSGIGLAICRKAIDHHAGRIWVESEPGHGAHFKFTLRGGADR